MGRLVLIDEEELRRIFREVLDEKIVDVGIQPGKANSEDDALCTSLYNITKLFHCSLPKAQHIKNSVPRDQYFQHGRKFAIRKSILLKTNKDLRRSK